MTAQGMHIILISSLTWDQLANSLSEAKSAPYLQSSETSLAWLQILIWFQQASATRSTQHMMPTDLNYHTETYDTDKSAQMLILPRAGAETSSGARLMSLNGQESCQIMFHHCKSLRIWYHGLIVQVLWGMPEAFHTAAPRRSD